MIDFVFKGRRELIPDKSLFCLQIIALPAPRAGIALITSKRSLLHLCPCSSSAREPEAAHKAQGAALYHLLLWSRGETAPSYPYTPRWRKAAKQGCLHAALAFKAKPWMLSPRSWQAGRSQRVHVGHCLLGKQLVKGFARKPPQPLQKRKERSDGWD